MANNSIALLRGLLDQEQLSRKALHSELHSKKSELLIINFVLHRMEKDAEKGKFDLEKIQEIRGIIDNYLENIRPLMSQIFNPVLKLIGLSSGIKEIVEFCKKKYEAVVIIVSEVDNLINRADILDQLGVYKICFDTTQYLCLIGHKKITIEIVYENGSLTLNLSGEIRMKTGAEQAELFDFEKLIKGNLTWRDAKILPETNWKSCFRFQFVYKITEPQAFD